MRALPRLVVVAVLAIASMAGAQDASRGIPRATRDAVIGCWDLGGGETVRIAPHGERGLRATRDVPAGLRSGPMRYADTVFYRRDRDAIQLGCRPRSQHGQFCEARPRPDGALDIAVYANGHDRRAPARLAETFVARRCARPDP